jgi:RHS repeat-associated protein
VQELSAGTPTANLLTGLAIDEYFTRTDGAVVSNYLTDALGSSVALADGTGAVQTEYSYEPFGATTTSGASTTSPYGFTGREADGTGLYYYRARYYHPTTVRFVGEDPIGLAGGSNVHAYVSNSPAMFRDPLGLQNILVGVGGSLVGATGVEGSMGVVMNPGFQGCGGVGGFASAGVGAGVSVGADVFAGYYTGAFTNLAGTTVNVNVSGGPISLSVMFDPRTGSIVGATAGMGPSALPVQASMTYSGTAAGGYAPNCGDGDKDHADGGDGSSAGGSGGSGGRSGGSGGRSGRGDGRAGLAGRKR